MKLMEEGLDFADIERRMNGAVSVLKTELSGLRTGRASAHLLDPVTVNAYGSQMPINQVATVNVPEPRMLSVQVWDKQLAGAVDRAIRDANLGLNPIMEGTLLRVPIPELNAQRRQEMVKVAHKYAEQARIAVRHVRIVTSTWYADDHRMVTSKAGLVRGRTIELESAVPEMEGRRVRVERGPQGPIEDGPDTDVP